MYGGMCHGSYAKSVFNTMKLLLDSGYEVQYRDMYNNSLVTEARDLFTQMFINSKCDYMFFIDADQSFKPEDVQPSGSMNASRIDNLVLQLNMNTTVSPARGPANARVYALNHNVLRVVEGFVGLLFRI